MCQYDSLREKKLILLNILISRITELLLLI